MLRKTLVSFMTLAFFYLVIGELIIIHQKAIFNYDIFADHPMAKPDKSNKSKIYQIKDKKNRVLFNLITFVSKIENFETSHINEISITFTQPLNCFKLIDCKYFPISFRGPPIKV